MYAQSGRTRSRTGTGRGNNRASSAASSSSAGNGQPNPCCAVRFRYSVTVPTPMAQAWAIARWDNPRSCLSRRTSRIFIISSLRAGIASPLPSKGQKHAGSGYRRAFTMTEIGVQLPEIGVQLPPKPVFNFARNRCSTSSEKPNHGGDLPQRYYARSCERVDGGWTDRRRRPCLQRLQWNGALCRRHVGSCMLAHDLDVDLSRFSESATEDERHRARSACQGLAERRVRRARPSEPRAGTVTSLSVRTLTGGDVGIGRDVRPSYVQVDAGA